MIEIDCERLTKAAAVWNVTIDLDHTRKFHSDSKMLNS